jgi:hypothetical protein
VTEQFQIDINTYSQTLLAFVDKKIQKGGSTKSIKRSFFFGWHKIATRIS